MSKTFWIIIGIVIVILVIAGLWYFYFRDTEQANTSSPGSTTSSQNQATQSASEKSATESATLKAISPYTGSGTATRNFDGTTFTHTVIANIADPAEGKFLEGWLVMKKPTLVFISTGKLVKENGVYKLTFTANQNYPEHKDIVITEEDSAKGLDGVPEEHVLEGTF